MIFADRNTATKFKFEVFDYTYGSDHFPTVVSSLSFGAIALDDVAIRPTMSIKNTDWSRVQGFLDLGMNGIDYIGKSGKDVYQHYLHIVRESLLLAGVKYRNIRKSNPIHRSNPWWSQKCDECIKKKRMLSKKF